MRVHVEIVLRKPHGRHSSALDDREKSNGETPPPFFPMAFSLFLYEKKEEEVVFCLIMPDARQLSFASALFLCSSLVFFHPDDLCVVSRGSTFSSGSVFLRRFEIDRSEEF